MFKYGFIALKVGCTLLSAEFLPRLGPFLQPRMVLELRLLLVRHSAQYRDADDEQSEVASSDLSILASSDSKIWCLCIGQCPSDSVDTN